VLLNKANVYPELQVDGIYVVRQRMSIILHSTPHTQCVIIQQW